MSEAGSTRDHDVVTRSGNIFSDLLLSASLLICALGSSLALAQHETHGMSNTGGVHVETMPASDEVVAKTPESLMLHFESEVRLVKLAVKESKQGEILIDFRYNPVAGVHFMQALPRLAPADYYKVEWAALEANGELIRGSFYWSFGEGAMPPSYYLNLIEHPDHIMSPDYRLL